MMKFTKIMALMLAMVCSTAVVRADEKTVADGDKTSVYVPISGNFGDYYQHNQIIYPATMLSDLNGKNITGLKFYIHTPASKSLGSMSFNVGMAEISDSNFGTSTYPSPSIKTNALTAVGVFATSGMETSYVEITFDDAYAYGGGNLLVDFQTKVLASDYADIKYYGLSYNYTDPIQSIHGHNSSSLASITIANNAERFIPKTTFIYTTGGVSCAKPDEVSTSSVEAKTATVQWTKASGVDKVQYALVEGTATPIDGTWSAATTDASKDLTGLKPETKYTFYVRSYCSDSEQSGAKSVEFTTGKSCFEPENLTYSNVGANTAVISWDHSTSGSETEYQYICVKKDETPDWSKAKSTNNFNAELSGLDPVTEYDVYVRSYCGTDDVSASVKESFTTICGKLSALPYAEDFNTGSNLPACWHRATTGSYPQIYSKQLFFNVAAGASQIVALPEIDLEIKQLTIELKYNTNTYDAAGNATLEVGYVDEFDNFTALSSAYGPAKNYTPVSVDLKDAATEAQNIAIRVTGVAASFAYVDDVVVKKTPKCPNPIELTWITPTYQGGVFTWAQGVDETRYQWGCVEKGKDVSSWTLLDENVYTATVTGLTSGKEYEFAVRSYCSAEKQGDEVRLAFTPLCASAEDVKVSGITNNSAVISWKAVDYATQYAVKIGSVVKNATTNTLTWSGLEDDTDYTVSVMVAAPCEGDYSAGVAFKTMCNALSVPYSENFDGVSGKVPDCWRLISENASTGVISGAAAYGGSGQCFDFFGTETQQLVLPQFANDMVGLTISFYCKSNNNATISIGYFEPGDDTFVSLKAIDAPTDYATEPTAVNLSDASENAQYIVIQHSNGSSAVGQTFLDNVSVMKTSDVPSSIETTESAKGVIKRIENGQLVIIRDGVRYNAIGTVMK